MAHVRVLCLVEQGGEPEGEPHKDRSATEEQKGDPLFAEFQKYDTSNRGYLSQYDVSDMMKRLGAPATLGFVLCL
jgi:Ca2+-binding EF-hand superfamily protein